MPRQLTRGPATSNAAPADTKPATKSAKLIEALSAKGGANMAALRSITGWQAHSVRAALTGLRKRGYTITRTRAEDGATIYAITAVPGSAS